MIGTLPAPIPTLPPTAGATIAFPQTLPGFPGFVGYRLEPLPDRPGFLRLRSESDGGPTFIVMRHAAGAGLLTEQDVADACAATGLDPAAAEVLLMVTAKAAGPTLRLSVNRRAPVLVDIGRALGFQVVLAQPDYAVRHALVT